MCVHACVCEHVCRSRVCTCVCVCVCVTHPHTHCLLLTLLPAGSLAWPGGPSPLLSSLQSAIFCSNIGFST